MCSGRTRKARGRMRRCVQRLEPWWACLCNYLKHELMAVPGRIVSMTSGRVQS